MKWCDFADGVYEWSDATTKARICSLEDIGAGEDIVDAILNIDDEKVRAQLIRKAMKLGAVFHHDDFADLNDELPQDVYAQLAEYGGFYLENPYFDENNFTWDDFYAEYDMLPIEMLMRCIQNLNIFGDADEVFNAISSMFDPYAADALYERARECGVHFSREQLDELGFIYDDCEGQETARSETIEQVDKTIYSTHSSAQHVKKPGVFAVLGAIGRGLFGGIFGHSDEHTHHNGQCDGNCATCPPHYGYRYGRWYYGHGHNYGCEFGGNKGGCNPY